MNDTKTLNIWTQRIAHERMPVLSHTVHTISKVCENDNAPRAAITNIILQDPAMTSHVLRVANSIYYSPRGTTSKLNTISRAVVVLGANVIRSICVSVSIVNELLKGGSREHLIRELARSFHAAVQARDLAIYKGEKSQEEIFIAALLYRIGEMAFWVFGENLRGLLDAELKAGEVTPGEAEQKVLGFRLSQLTVELCREWNLSELIPMAVKGMGSTHSISRLISLCYRLALNVENSWNTPEVDKIIADLSENSGLSIEELRPRLENNTRHAITLATEYGAHVAADHIPLPPTVEAPIVEAVTVGSNIAQPDPMLQLKILRELSAMVTGEADYNDVIEIVMEGIYRGVGMDRVMYAIYFPQDHKLEARSALGEGADKLLNGFKWRVDKSENNLFALALEEQRSCWYPEKIPAKARKDLPTSISSLLGPNAFFLAPAIANFKSIGIFYADRASSHRPLDIESYESFAHFTLQANISIDFIGTKHSGHK
ncbi:MAG: HDOD domain-containing protein [Deltaproteobacteria bacterium]|nr:HDOD domain-containing protein [Deltaproteobacteria bacterium]